MTVKLITRVQLPGSRPRGPAMRRAYIYPHRSVRSWQPKISRVILALISAALLIALVAAGNSELFVLHNRICVALLHLAGIPVDEVEIVDVFPGLSSAPVPVTPVVRLEDRPELGLAAFGAAVLLMTLLYRQFPLARGFVLFLAALLVVSGAVVVFFPAQQFGAADLGQIWLRGEVLVWLLLPLFSAGMVTMLHPAGILGVAWAVLLQIYALVWSAVRLAFVVGVMHFTGMLFVPLLWFAFGLLADMVYLMVFYSMAVHWIASRAWGRGAQ